MEITNLMNSLQDTLGQHLPKVAGALAILVIGWLVAVLFRAGVRKALSLLKLNQKIAKGGEVTINLESGIAKGVYWTILLMVFIAVFNVLDLELVSKPLDALVTQVFKYIPRIVAGGVLLLVAWLLATIVRMMVIKALDATDLDERLGVTEGGVSTSKNIGNVVYWFIFLLFLPAILGAFQLEGLLIPVENMVNSILAMLPNIIAAGVIGLIGWFVAKILRDIVTNLLSAAGADRIGVRVGLEEGKGISHLIGTVVFFFVFVPALVAALDALQMQSISAPATNMLNVIMQAIPDILAAVMILVIAFYVARFVANLVTTLLQGMNFDKIPSALGLEEMFAQGVTPSVLIGRLLIFFTMLFAAIEASDQLGMTQIGGLITTFVEFGGKILLGSVILAVGFWLANIIYKVIISGGQGKLAAGIARFAILGLVTAMGLHAMGLADDIVNMAFGLTLGAIAIAVALSFGLGGREAAGKQMEYWFKQMRGEP
ncbi:mechanosensitive ion channel [Methylotuvimicrobium sp. KM1]|uniref:mechanosensitive ion channel n=1 Tax=Methylotuvimicrobium sp. KM1 TaxID=3377707 RepID=UPI00384DC23A